MNDAMMSSGFCVLLCGWSCLLSLLLAGMIIYAVLLNNKKLLLFIVPVFLLQWFFNQCYISYQKKPWTGMANLGYVQSVVAWSPVIQVMIQCLFTGILLVLGRRLIVLSKSQITNNAIKEGMDNIQTGLCWYYQDGFVALKNRQMDDLSVKLTGNQLMNGVRFEEIIKEKDFRKTMTQTQEAEGKTVYLISEGYRVWEISVKKQTDPHIPAEMSAKDITAEYERTRSLMDQQMELQELSERLTLYNKEITDTMTNQEILSAKARIHDELGIALLSAKRYLSESSGSNRSLSEGDERAKERAETIRFLKENISVLYEDTSGQDQVDEYDLMFRTAEQVFVQMCVEGSLPQNQPAKHITAIAMHECITNTIRHAEGDAIRIQVEETGLHKTIVTFTNNGRKPEKEIIPHGGLLSLQEIVQHAGGSMEIASFPEFILRLTLYS